MPGCDVVVREVSAELMDKGLKSIEKIWLRTGGKGNLDAVEAADAVRARLHGTVDLTICATAISSSKLISEQLAGEETALLRAR